MPVRKIPMGRNSITGRFSLGPGRGSVGFESTLERDFVRLMTFDPDFESIEEQPVRIDYTGPDGRPRHYTPDYLVQRRYSPPLLAEIKPRKFLKPDLEPKFTAARTFAVARGWTFEVWTERDIRTPRLDNIRFLEMFNRAQADPGMAARILRVVEREGAMTGEEVLSACWTRSEDQEAGERILWHLLARGQLCADISHDLTLKTVLERTRGTL